MGRRRNRGRNVNGILLLDKPFGISSNDALQRVKYLYKAAKAGHTGSLDPLATGLLPLCFGEGTKISAFLLDADKRYRVRVRLGETTATADAEGEVVERRSTDAITEEKVHEAVESFLGEIQQLPPMYSAVKHEGERLYKLARRGLEVERKPRTITIYELHVTAFDLPEFELEVHCSKGTYIRTLAEDIGEQLGCGAHVVGLCRTAVGPFNDEDMVTIEDLQASLERDRYSLDAFLKPIDCGLTNWPDVKLSDDTAYYLRLGQAVMVPKAPTRGWVRLYAPDDSFIGVGYIQDDGKVAPRRLMSSAEKVVN